MAIPDIVLGPGDTAPILQFTLRGPEKDDGSDGDPLDLSGATVVFTYQDRGQTANAITRPVSIIGDPALGNIELDWAATGGPVDPGDYDCCFVVTYLDGHQVTVPDGADPDNAGTLVDEFLWMHVRRMFAVVA